MPPITRRGLTLGTLGAAGLAIGGRLVTMDSDYQAGELDRANAELDRISRQWDSLSALAILATVSPMHPRLSRARGADATRTRALALAIHGQAAADSGYYTDAVEILGIAQRVALAAGDTQTGALATAVIGEIGMQQARAEARQAGRATISIAVVDRLTDARHMAGTGPAAVIAATLEAQALAETGATEAQVLGALTWAEQAAGTWSDQSAGFGRWSHGHRLVFGSAALIRAGALSTAGVWLHDSEYELAGQPGALAASHMYQGQAAAKVGAYDAAYAAAERAIQAAGDRAGAAWLAAGIAAMAERAGADWPGTVV